MLIVHFQKLLGKGRLSVSMEPVSYTVFWLHNTLDGWYVWAVLLSHMSRLGTLSWRVWQTNSPFGVAKLVARFYDMLFTWSWVVGLVSFSQSVAWSRAKVPSYPTLELPWIKPLIWIKFLLFLIFTPSWSKHACRCDRSFSNCLLVWWNYDLWCD